MTTPLDAARAYVAAGFKVIPVPHREKAPVLPGWQSLDLGDDDLPHHFNGHPVNIGILLADSSLGDVDVDTPEAGALADLFLPPTRTFGRASKPRSHWIYRTLERRPTQRYQVKLGGVARTLVEYRDRSRKGTPVQTVFPPSTHESGETITWDGAAGAPLAEADAGALYESVRHLAGAAVLLSLYPRGGGARHDAAGALASVLARSEVADRTVQIVERFAAWTGDDEVADRVAFAEATLAAIRAGEAVTGGKTLKGFLTSTAEEEKAFETALDWLGFRSLGTPAPQAAPETVHSAERAESSEADDKPARRSAASVLVEMITSDPTIELWHDDEGEPYVSFPTPAGGREHAPVRSKNVRRYLHRRFWEAEGRTPGGQATDDALGVLEGKALYDGETHTTAVRVAETGEGEGVRVWLDLGDESGRVVETYPGGWHVVPADACPVRFVRRPGALPLPEPRRGGRVAALRRFVHTTESAFVLVVAWLVMALRGRGPYPLLGLTGEQGTGKSTAARYIRSLVDPNVAALRALPRNEREAFISARSAHVLTYDNVSTVPPLISDVLCRISTGGGYAVRALYADADEQLFDAQNPQMLTGIGDLVTRSDLAERTLVVPLERIGDGERETEASLEAAFAEAQPLLLGALLDGVAGGLATLPTLQTPRLPRMADFARFCLAAEHAGGLGTEPGAFLSAFDGVRDDLMEAALEGDPVGPVIRDLLGESPPTPGGVLLTGTASELLDRLTLHYRRDDEKRRLPTTWPASPRALSSALTRIAPALRSIGIEAERAKVGRDRSRLWVLRYTGDGRQETLRPQPSAPSAEDRDGYGIAANGTTNADSRADGPQTTDRPQGGQPSAQPSADAQTVRTPSAGNRPSGAGIGGTDGADGADGCELLPFSTSSADPWAPVPF